MSFVTFEDMLRKHYHNQLDNVYIPQIKTIKSLKNMSVKEVLQMYKLSNIVISSRILFSDFSSKPFGMK